MEALSKQTKYAIKVAQDSLEKRVTKIKLLDKSHFTSHGFQTSLSSSFLSEAFKLHQ